MRPAGQQCARSDATAIDLLLRSLCGLAEVDVSIFRREPTQHALYFAALKNTVRAAQGGPLERWRFVYTRERETCGKSNCWNTWAELSELATPWGGPIRADCKALAAAHAAASLVRDPSRAWWVGIRAGCHIGHAVAGVGDPGEVEALDPCIPAGMPPIPSYDGIHWKRVRDDE